MTTKGKALLHSQRGKLIRHLHERACGNAPIDVYKTDCPKAKIGNPEEHDRGSAALRDKARRSEQYISGSGKGAYICFRIAMTSARPARCISPSMPRRRGCAISLKSTGGESTKHPIVAADGGPPCRIVPETSTPKRRAAEVKAGAEVKKQTKLRETRVMRIGVPVRPKAKIKNNIVYLPAKDAA